MNIRKDIDSYFDRYLLSQSFLVTTYIYRTRPSISTISFPTTQRSEGYPQLFSSNNKFINTVPVLHDTLIRKLLVWYLPSRPSLQKPPGPNNPRINAQSSIWVSWYSINTPLPACMRKSFTVTGNSAYAGWENECRILHEKKIQCDCL